MPKRLTNIETINKLNSLGLKYDFSKFQYNGDRLNKSVVICPVHGEFEISFHNIIKSHKGLICKKCRYEYKQKIMLEKYHGDNYIPELKIPQRDRHRTKEQCKQEALKYNTKKDFKANSRNIYEFATNHKFLAEICSHMIKLGDRKHKCVYCYEFPDNHVYVGITNNFFRRKIDRERNFKDSVTQHIIKTNLVPLHKQLTDYIPVEKAVYLEGYYVEEYRNNNWYILNKVKTGAIGGSIIKWTKEKCLEEALKYNTINDFYNNCSGAYISSKKNDWYEEITKHMIKLENYNKIWYKENCRIEALKYNTRGEFNKYSASAYQSARVNNWLNEICQHMKAIYKPHGYWTLETCKADAKKYISISEWHYNSACAYRYAREHNYLKECCQFMGKKWTRRPKILCV